MLETNLRFHYFTTNRSSTIVVVVLLLLLRLLLLLLRLLRLLVLLHQHPAKQPYRSGRGLDVDWASMFEPCSLCHRFPTTRAAHFLRRQEIRAVASHALDLLYTRAAV